MTSKLSLEQSVKDQFAKVFTSNDWGLFKEVAEINLAEAAMLKKSSFKGVEQKRQLLIRNTRKRLLIGIGSELLLKAVYLKTGHSINKPLSPGKDLNLPFKLAKDIQGQLNSNDTFTFNQLTDHLKNVLVLPNPDLVLNGLKIAKVFRNKEGHVVTSLHKYDPLSYRAIEAAFIEIYARAFDEKLTVRFSLEAGEKGVWCVAPIDSRDRS